MRAIFHKGFTLLELLIVIGLIGALSAIGVPMFKDYIGSSKVSIARANHNLAVNETRRLLMECETKAIVTLNTGPNGETQTFPCASGASNLRVQLTAHYFWRNYRNAWDKNTCCAVAGDSRMTGYQLGYSCGGTPTVGFTDICDVSPTLMRFTTNIGTPSRGNNVVITDIEISP
jgi:type IV pilus assembly protein PilA